VSDSREVLDTAKTAAEQLFASGHSPDVLAGLTLLILEGLPRSHREALVAVILNLHCVAVALPTPADTVH
jgi:hypothetical protein